MKRIPLQVLQPRDYANMEKQLKAVFYKILFEPIIKILRPAVAQPTEIRNAGSDALLDALRTGRVQYNAGTFSGKFSAAISRALRAIGANLDARVGVYRLAVAKVPAWVRAEATAYNSRAQQTFDSILDALNKTQIDLPLLVQKNQVDAVPTVKNIVEGFTPIAESMELHPVLAFDSLRKLSKAYSKNMDLWVETFTKKEILKLREIVEANSYQGYRFERLIEQIKSRYSVTESKAKFLARQETSLFMSKHKQLRYEEAGIQRYRWSTAHDERVRHSHAELNGQIFFFSSPPLVDGSHQNPGEPFNCRCQAIPIFEEYIKAA